MSNITRVEVCHFQSLWDVGVDLGDLTVVVGPSNSGKSAFGRALRAVARNVNSPGIVSSGATTATVILHTDDKAVSLERGKGSSTYRVIAEGQEERYAKAGRDVPEDVANILHMWETDPELHFATQFDPPYLLASTATTVSKVLGDLTNVSMLAEAAREANRRRQEAQRKATYLQEEVAKALQTLQERHAGLPTRKATCEAVKSALTDCFEVQERLTRLTKAVDRAQAAKLVADDTNLRVSLAKDRVDKVDKRLTVTAQAAERYRGLEQLVRVIEQATQTRGRSLTEAAAYERQADECLTKISTILTEKGHCPLCGQKTSSS